MPLNIGQGCGMRFGNIIHVDVVTDAGSIRSVVIVTKDFQVIDFAFRSKC
ncbi:MAG: hypothetical protein ACI9R3_003753 [Verrucomicrobiales bacterium]|jgi:hypothetical protein